MNDNFRLNIDDLYGVLTFWDENLKESVFIAACGGTALTLYGHKESTKDVDFLIPDPAHYQILIQTIKTIGYKHISGDSFRHPEQPWIFDLFRGQTIFQTELLDPVHGDGNHRVIKTFKNIVLACITPDDLIISKMFRGTLVDVQDSIVMIKAEQIHLKALAERYKDTANYYYNPETCKRNLGYLISEMERENLDATPLREMIDLWTP